MSTEKKEKGGTPPTKLTSDDSKEPSVSNATEAKSKDITPVKEKSVKDEKPEDKSKSDKPKGKDAKGKGKGGKKAIDDMDVEIGESLKDVRQFLKEVVIEFGKITWPGRPQVIQETWSVLFLVTAITLLVLGFDWFLGHAVFGPLEHWARLHGGGVGSGHL